jgi:hypothetical protein
MTSYYRIIHGNVLAEHVSGPDSDGYVLVQRIPSGVPDEYHVSCLRPLTESEARQSLGEHPQWVARSQGAL